MHCIFPPTQKVAADDLGIKYRKKYSILDSQESFAIVGGTQEEVEAKINLLKLQNKKIPPQLIIIGDVCNIKSIAIAFEDIKYNFLNIIDAIDVLFKIFFVFNLEYPSESNLFYNFLQDFFYEIPLKKKNAKIATTKTEILNISI